MKKLLLCVALAAFTLVGCGEKKEEKVSESSLDSKPQQELVKLKVGATPVPHAEILEFIKPMLKDQGIDLQIVNFSDYVMPNTSLNDGSIDANFFQHEPFLEATKKDRGFKLESIAKIHIEPLGFYSSKFTSLDSIPERAIIAIPNDPSNGGRALLLLHNKGLITLKDPSNLISTELDIIDNPKKLKIKPMEAAGLPRVLGDVDGAVINGNYALQSGIKTNEALLLEGAESPYANILVVQESRINDEALQKLKSTLQSKEVKEFMKEKYQGEILPAF